MSANLQTKQHADYCYTDSSNTNTLVTDKRSIVCSIQPLPDTHK